MTSRLRHNLICLATVLLLAGCGDAVVMSPIPRDGNILAFGDSLTAGFGAPDGDSYPAQLARLSGMNVINAGVSGEESSAGRERLASLLDLHRPALLILCHGGNDLLRKRPIDQLENNLRDMIAMAQDRGVEVLMLGVPAPGIFLSSEEVYERVAGETGVAFIPELIPDVLSSPALKSDAVHPNAAGYGEMAAGVYSQLEKLGAIQ